MSRHSIYTEIDVKSYAAIVKNRWLSEVLLALLVDPLEAEDVSDSIRKLAEETIDIEVNGRVFAAPISLADFQSLPSKDAFEKLKITLSQWTMTTDRADAALKRLTTWDRRFGAWSACAVAREALQFVRKGELRPLRAIETTEAWVLGTATVWHASNAAAAAYAAHRAAVYALDPVGFAADSASIAAVYAARVASFANAPEGASASANAAVAAAQAAYAASSTANSSDAELVRLREVVSNACLTFPG